MRRAIWLGAFAFSTGLPLLLLAPPRQDEKPAPDKAEGADLDARTHRAIAKGIEWLAKHQNSDGGWGCGVPRTPSSAGITGLVCAALMANGATPTAGEYSDQLQNGLNWLLNRANRTTGAITGTYVTELGNAYDHTWAVIALSMAYGMWRERAGEIRERIDGALTWLDKQQNPDGGWTRYGGHSSDPAVTANAWLAYRASHSIGVRIEAAEAKIEKYAQHAAMRGFGGSSGAGTQYINDVAGWIRMRYGMGTQSEKDVQKAAEHISKHYLSKEKPAPVSEWDYVAVTHLAPAFFHERGAEWNRWFPAARNYFLDIQQGDGSWNIVNCLACKAFATALALVFLQTPKQILPLGDL